MKSKLLIFILLFINSSWAAEVTQVKDSKVMLKMEEGEFSEGDKVYLLNSDGKKSAIIKIKKTKGNKALAELVKGKAKNGMVTQSTSMSADSKPESSSQTYAGITAGLNMNSMSMTARSGSSSESISLSGTSFSIKGLYDYPVISWLNARLVVGLENFAGTVSPKVAAVCTGACTVNYQYLALEGHAQVNITSRPNRFWLGAGYAYLMGMSASTTIANLDTSSKSNYMLVFSAGYDYGLSGGSFIPISFEYGSFPGTDVTATAMTLRAGYGMKF